MPLLRIDPRAVDEAGVRAWAALAARAVEANAFYRPEFLLPNVIERGVRVELLVAVDGDRWIACLPVRSLPASRRFPLPWLEALIDDYTFSGTPLLDREAVDQAADGLVRLVRAERRATALLIPLFEPGGPARRAIDAAALRQGAKSVRVGGMDRAGWRRGAERHFPGPAFNRSDRKELRRRERLLAAELGGELRVVDRTHHPTAIDEFLTMEDSGWKAERGNPFARLPGDTAFFRRMCAEMAAAGCLEIVALEVAGRTLDGGPPGGGPDALVVQDRPRSRVPALLAGHAAEVPGHRRPGGATDRPRGFVGRAGQRAHESPVAGPPGDGHGAGADRGAAGAARTGAPVRQRRGPAPADVPRVTRSWPAERP